MKLEDALNETDISKKINNLKLGRLKDMPDVSIIQKGWDTKEHDVFNPVLRPDKKIYLPVYDSEGNDTDKTTTVTEKVNRVSLALQKLIVRRAASFLFGNPVKVIASDQTSKVTDAVNRILLDAKQVSLNKRVARTCFAATEVAEYWYAVKGKEKHNTYGFETDNKIKCAVFSPLKGDKLYPFFNEFGDMVAFSREYVLTEGTNKVTCFETWTADKYTRYRHSGGGWQNDMDQESVNLKLGKIPIVYASQDNTEWDDVQTMIDRLEKIMSNFGDTNDYHGAPKIVVKGSVKGFARKGDSGGILEIENEGDVKLLEYTNAPESVKTEIDNLLRMVFTITQTPDISFESVKGLGSAASGQGLKMLFMDAHLKAMDKMEIFDEYLQRRFNILKAFVSALNSDMAGAAKNLELIPDVTPFMINDDGDRIENIVTALNGGIMSRRTAVAHNPLIDDADKEMDLIAEEKEANETSPEELDKLNNEEEEDTDPQPES